MAQVIKIKRSNSATNPSNLKEGELAYIHSNNTGGNLYIGRPGTGDAQTGIASDIDIIGGLIDHNKLDGISAGAEVNPDQVSAAERTAGTESAERSFSPADVKSMIDTHALTGLSAATSSAFGGIKLHDNTAQTTAPETVSSDANRTYAVQLNASSQASVNVPWTDTLYTLPTATSTTLGGIELFSDTAQSTAANTVTSTANRTYGIQLNSDSQAVVNVPWTDTVYTGSTGVTVDAANKTIAIGQSVSTTDNVTFDDLTLTGSTYLDNDEGIRFSTQGVGLGFNVGNTAIIPTRITLDELPISTMSTNERADVHRYIDRVADGTENAPATKYLHLFDINGSGSITADDKSAWDSAVGAVLGISQEYQDYLNAKNNATDYYTDFVQDIIDGTDDSWITSTKGISLGTSNNAFNEIHAKGSATIGDRLTLEKSTSGGSGKVVFQNTVDGENDVAITLNEEGSFTIVKHDDDYDDNSSGAGTTETLLKVNRFNELSEIASVNLSGSTTSVIFNNPDQTDRYDYQLTNYTDKLRLQYSQTQFANQDVTTLVTFSNDKVDVNADFDADGTVYLGKAAVIGEGDANNPDEPAKHTTVRANLIVDGDLTVSGTTTTVNTTTINLGDNIIELNSDIGANDATQNAGIEINRGNYTNVQLFWDETNHDWRVDTVGDVATAATTSPLLTAENFETKVTELDGGTFS